MMIDFIRTNILKRTRYGDKLVQCPVCNKTIVEQGVKNHIIMKAPWENVKELKLHQEYLGTHTEQECKPKVIVNQ